MTQTTQDQPSLLVGHGIPKYQEITPSHIKTYIPILLKEIDKTFYGVEKELDERLNQKQLLTWDEVMMPLHQINTTLLRLRVGR